MIRSSKLNYLQSLLRQARHAPWFAATLWSQVNEVIGHTKHHQSPLHPDLSLDSVNNFFRTVAVSHEHNSAEFFVTPSIDVKEVFQFKRIQLSEVISLLSNLDIKKSTGPDGISALFYSKLLRRLPHH